jgi:hypothetical protein
MNDDFAKSAKQFLGADAQTMTKAMDAQPAIDNTRHVNVTFRGNDWEESKHPRSKEGSTAGQFTSGSGGGAAKAEEPKKPSVKKEAEKSASAKEEGVYSPSKSDAKKFGALMKRGQEELLANAKEEDEDYAAELQETAAKWKSIEQAASAGDWNKAGKLFSEMNGDEREDMASSLDDEGLTDIAEKLQDIAEEHANSSEPSFKGDVDQFAKEISKHEYFEDRLEYSAGDLSDYYDLSKEQGEQLYKRLHELTSEPVEAASKSEKADKYYGDILNREFKKKFPKAKNVETSFGDDETIHVKVDGKEYVMEIGSDDDNFDFKSKSGERVSFDYPEDWFEGPNEGEAEDARPPKKLTPEEHAEQIKKKDPFQKKGATFHSLPPQTLGSEDEDYLSEAGKETLKKKELAARRAKIVAQAKKINAMTPSAHELSKEGTYYGGSNKDGL